MAYMYSSMLEIKVLVFAGNENTDSPVYDEIHVVTFLTEFSFKAPARWVDCKLYEGNDFVSNESHPQNNI